MKWVILIVGLIALAVALMSALGAMLPVRASRIPQGALPAAATDDLRRGLPDRPIGAPT